MDLKVTYITWLLAIFINQIMCDDRPASGGGGAGAGGQSGSAGASGHGGGAPGGSGAGGQGGGAPGSAGGSHGGADGAGVGGQSGAMGLGAGAGLPVTGMNGMAGMAGMAGMQLPFPFFPAFACEVECLPMPIQFFQQPVQQPSPAPVTQPPTTQPPPTTMPPPKPTVQPVTYTPQMYMMYPNWCQGWCKFFYKPTPPTYYAPNCILFSWMEMGMQANS